MDHSLTSDIQRYRSESVSRHKFNIIVSDENAIEIKHISSLPITDNNYFYDTQSITYDADAHETHTYEYEYISDEYDTNDTKLPPVNTLQLSPKDSDE